MIKRNILNKKTAYIFLVASAIFAIISFNMQYLNISISRLLNDTIEVGPYKFRLPRGTALLNNSEDKSYGETITNVNFDLMRIYYFPNCNTDKVFDVTDKYIEIDSVEQININNMKAYKFNNKNKSETDFSSIIFIEKYCLIIDSIENDFPKEQIEELISSIEVNEN